MARWAVRRQVCAFAYASASSLIFSSRVSGSIVASFQYAVAGEGCGRCGTGPGIAGVTDESWYRQPVGGHGPSAAHGDRRAVVRGHALRARTSPFRSWLRLAVDGVVSGWRVGRFPHAEGVLAGDPPAPGLERGEDVAVVGVQLAAYPGEAVAARVLGRHRVGHPPDESVQVAPLDQLRAPATRGPPLAPYLGGGGRGCHAAGPSRVVTVAVVAGAHRPRRDDAALGHLIPAHVAEGGIRPGAEITLHHRVGQLGQRYRIGRVVNRAAAQFLGVAVAHPPRLANVDVEGTAAGPAVHVVAARLRHRTAGAGAGSHDRSSHVTADEGSPDSWSAGRHFSPWSAHSNATSVHG